VRQDPASKQTLFERTAPKWGQYLPEPMLQFLLQAPQALMGLRAAPAGQIMPDNVMAGKLESMPGGRAVQGGGGGRDYWHSSEGLRREDGMKWAPNPTERYDNGIVRPDPRYGGTPPKDNSNVPLKPGEDPYQIDGPSEYELAKMWQDLERKTEAWWLRNGKPPPLDVIEGGKGKPPPKKD